MGSFINNVGVGQFEAEKYGIDRAAFDPNADEQSFVKALQARSAGTAPSAAQMQMRQGLDTSIQNANALAASQGSINPALAARMAQQSAAQSGQQVNQQGAILRAQEQAQADSQLGGVLESQRSARMNREALAVGQQGALNSANAQSFEGSQNRRGAAINNFAKSAASFGTMNQGGLVPGYAMGGAVGGEMGSDIPNMQNAFAQALSQMQNYPVNNQVGQHDKSFAVEGKDKDKDEGKGEDEGEIFIPQASTEASTEVAQPGPSGMSEGAIVPGKPKVQADAEVNDTVPAMLSPGEMVIPRTVVQDGPDAVRAFAKAILKKGMPA